MKYDALSVFSLLILFGVGGSQLLANYSSSQPSEILQTPLECKCEPSVANEDSNGSVPPKQLSGIYPYGITGQATISQDGEVFGICTGPGCANPRNCTSSVSVSVEVVSVSTGTPDPHHVRAAGVDYPFPTSTYPMKISTGSVSLTPACGDSANAKATVRDSNQTKIANISFEVICGDCDA